MGRIQMEVYLRSTHLYRHSCGDTFFFLCIHYILMGKYWIRPQPMGDEHLRGFLPFPTPDTSPWPRAQPAPPDEQEQFASRNSAGAKCADLHPQPDNLSHC